MRTVASVVDARLTIQFLVPVRDRAGKPYPRGVKKEVERNLEDRFGGWTRADLPLHGAWRNPETQEIERDLSWRYEVWIAPERVGEIEIYLAELAHRLGQKAIGVVYGTSTAKVIPARAPGSET